MHFTRARELVVAGLIGLVLFYALFQMAYGSFPQLPLFVGATLFVLALVEVVQAFSVRSKIRERRVVNAIAVARSVALAKASSLAGAIMLGGWLGATAYLLPRRTELSAASHDLRSALIGGFSAAALIAAALWLEHCCRAPERRDQDRAGDSTG
ncbi:MAG: hypothetical protein QOI21_581 [Actinomycetota bacterium]|jgi:uncharacterized membrane protein (DUF373 family)|nr:hypothetical protein [Actinomycetota bacterium]